MRKVDSELGDTGHGYISSQRHFFALNNVCLFVSAGLQLLSSTVSSNVWGTQQLCPCVGFPTVENIDRMYCLVYQMVE